MPTKYRKAAPERPPEYQRQRRVYPELPLAAEIAGVSYWMAYKVRRGKAQSEKVELAIKVARERLRVQNAEEKKAARQQLRDLRAQERKLERMLGKGKAA